MIKQLPWLDRIDLWFIAMITFCMGLAIWGSWQRQDWLNIPISVCCAVVFIAVTVRYARMRFIHRLMAMQYRAALADAENALRMGKAPIGDPERRN